MPADAVLIAAPVISERERFYIPDFEIPLNVCYLAAALQRAGFSTSIVDMNVADPQFDLAKYISDQRPFLAGIAAYTPFIHKAHEYAQTVKSAVPEIKTLIGGYHASALPERTLEEFPAFDFLAAGEGENTIVELAGALRGGRNPNTTPGLYYRDNGSIAAAPKRERSDNIDDFPFPARALLDQSRYKVSPINYVELPTTGILASRGCDHRCAFCSQSVFGGRARVRSAENITAEIEQCRADFGMKGFRFYDDNLTAYRDTCLEFCDLLLSRNIHIHWNCFSRVDSVDPELLGAMKRAGCHQIKYGVETGTEKMIDVIKKGVCLDQDRRAVEITRQAGIECQISIILGLPGETIGDMRETVRFAVSLRPDLVGFNLFKPLPGSPLYKKLEREGMLRHFDWSEYSIKRTRSVVKDQYPRETLETELRRAYMKFFFRPGYVLQRLSWFARQPKRETLRLLTGLKYIFLNLLRRN